jgi:hypothetical protein
MISIHIAHFSLKSKPYADLNVQYRRHKAAKLPDRLTAAEEFAAHSAACGIQFRAWRKSSRETIRSAEIPQLRQTFSAGRREKFGIFRR